jgi:hypothetical protein
MVSSHHSLSQPIHGLTQPCRDFWGADDNWISGDQSVTGDRVAWFREGVVANPPSSDFM